MAGLTKETVWILLEAGRHSEKTTIRTAEPDLTYANPGLTLDVPAEFRQVAHLLPIYSLYL